MTCFHLDMLFVHSFFFYKKLCDSDRAKNYKGKFNLKEISSSEPLVSYKKKFLIKKMSVRLEKGGRSQEVCM